MLSCLNLICCRVDGGFGEAGVGVVNAAFTSRGSNGVTQYERSEHVVIYTILSFLIPSHLLGERWPLRIYSKRLHPGVKRHDDNRGCRSGSLYALCSSTRWLSNFPKQANSLYFQRLV